MQCHPAVVRLVVSCCVFAIRLAAVTPAAGPIPICLEGNLDQTNRLTIGQGELIASTLFRQIRIGLEWHNLPAGCPEAREPVRVRIWTHTPADYHRGASGTSQPYDGVHAEIFLDRMQRSVQGSVLTALVGHVLAHEIAHVLGGTDGHSTGVMQPFFSPEDLRKMTILPLRFPMSYIIVLQDGVRTRHERLAEIRTRGVDDTRAAEVSLRLPKAGRDSGPGSHQTTFRHPSTPPVTVDQTEAPLSF